jgi:hypothetical protein
MVTLLIGAVVGGAVGVVIGAKGSAGIASKIEAGFALISQTVHERIAAIEAAIVALKPKQ